VKIQVFTVVAMGSCGQVSGSQFLEYSKNREGFGLHTNIITDTDMAAHGSFLFAIFTLPFELGPSSGFAFFDQRSRNSI
jgi:hypothetical protein